MYIDKLILTNVRTFVKNELRLLHPDSTFRSPKAEPNGDEFLLPKPKLPNVNLSCWRSYESLAEGLPFLVPLFSDDFQLQNTLDKLAALEEHLQPKLTLEKTGTLTPVQRHSLRSMRRPTQFTRL